MSLTKAEARNVDKLRDAGADLQLLLLFIMFVRVLKGVESMPSRVRDEMLDALKDLTNHMGES